MNIKWPRPEKVRADDIERGWSMLRPGYGWCEVTNVRWPGGFPETVIVETNEYALTRYMAGDVVVVRKWRNVLRREMGGARTDRDDSGDYTRSFIYWKTIPSATAAEVRHRANMLYRTYCKHEYDCCGNFYFYVSSVRRVKSGEWVIVVKGVRNV